MVAEFWSEITQDKDDQDDQVAEFFGCSFLLGS
jgi:hypothetical protein